jgi:recombination protein RecT
MDCTPQSLLACVMTCAQLGLEPDQFLGQAYLVPFKDNKSGTTICTLIPGYRGYIALARRSGEMQTVSAQVVYERDEFNLAYGINDTLEHRPNLSGDRGKPIGAYCVFKYKDGGYSFDFLPVTDIDKVRSRSRASNDGPWVTDWDEMAKKTVIKRHSKLAPLSVEFQRAVALEDRALSGEPQADLLTYDDGVIDAEGTSVPQKPTFESTIPKGALKKDVAAYLEALAGHEKTTVEAVKDEAIKDPEKFWMIFNAWVKQQKVKDPVWEMAPGPCPNNGENIYSRGYCDSCKDREGCPVWG